MASYRGIVVDIPAGEGSLNLDDSLMRVPMSDLLEAEGIVYEGRVWRKEPGAVKFDAAGITGAPIIVATFDWWPNSTTQRLVTAALDGKLYKEVGGDLDSITLASGLSTTKRGRFVAAGLEGAGKTRKLFYLNGLDSPRVLSADGVTASQIATPATDWSGTNQPINALVHRTRLWALGNDNAPHNLYGSGPDNHEDFACATAVVQPVYPGVGEKLYAGVSFKGLLFAFKHPRGVFWLDDSPVNITSWAVNQLTDALGIAASPYSVLNLDEDVLFLTETGHFHLLSVTTQGGVRAADSLSDQLGISKWMRDNLNLARLDQARSVWFGQKKLALFALPRTGATTNTARLMFDFSDVVRGGRPKFSYSFRDVSEALALRKDADKIERPVFGDNAGVVWSLDQASRSKAGAGYLGQYRIPDIDFSQVNSSIGAVKKNFDYLQITQNPQAAGNGTVEVLIDGVLYRTLTFDLRERVARQHIGGQGYSFGLRFKNSVNAEDFSVTKQTVFMRQAGL